MPNIYILPILIVFIPINIIAKNKECDDYWKPKIKSAKKEVKKWTNEYNSVFICPSHPVYHEVLQTSSELLSFYRDELSKLKEAKKICYNYGLKSSIDAFNR